jgi:hypothetical protein
MRSEGFEPAIPATKRPQTYALDRAATVIGNRVYCYIKYILRHVLGQNPTKLENVPCYLLLNEFTDILFV